MLGQFDNIRQLYIHTKGLEKDLITAVVSLLSGMPTLSSLNIKSEPNNRQLKCVEPTSVSKTVLGFIYQPLSLSPTN